MSPAVPTESSSAEVSYADVERIARAWDKALAEKNIPGLLNLYARDAVLESPLIPFLLGRKEGICRGWEEMRPFYERLADEVARVSNEARPRHGPDPLIQGNKVVWESPRIAPGGEPSETSSFAEVWELHDGLIKRHHAYWGWDRIAKRERHVASAPRSKPTTEANAARIYHLWDKYVRERDLDGLLAFYAEEATIQSPLVAVFFGPGNGILRGKTEVRKLLVEALKRRPDDEVRFHRDGFQWNGKTLFWEYPAETPEGRYQVDLAEVMDLEGGLIKRHCIYWGWYGVERISKSAVKEAQESPNPLGPVT